MRPNDIEFSGERKRVRCNEGLGRDFTGTLGNEDRRIRVRGAGRHGSVVGRIVNDHGVAEDGSDVRLHRHTLRREGREAHHFARKDGRAGLIRGARAIDCSL